MTDFARLERELHDQQRPAILAQHARLSKNGRPEVCTPSRAELSGEQRRREGKGSDGKVIYDTVADARAAARKLEAIGARPMIAYPCRRSRHGHYHLKTDKHRAEGSDR
ncbi:hypothetical protein ACFXGA_06305 [Actinosynnema sp. NPDC059335]|uniref:hypothetical protein n=1 Tax=Actinosynnema sp. NPDC059335 TaxID=3346804 RepID=UPI00366AEF1A